MIVDQGRCFILIGDVGLEESNMNLRLILMPRQRMKGASG